MLEAVMGRGMALARKGSLGVSIKTKNLEVRRRLEVPALRLPDLLSKDLDVVFCGINPGLSAARAGHHFSSPSNRFWRVLYLAGFIPHPIEPENDRTILEYGYGLTTAAERPTVSASEVTSHEFLKAAKKLERKILRYRPRFVAFLGKPAFAAVFRQKRVNWGEQFMKFGAAEVWVLPNPSGLNRAFSLAQLVSAYRELRAAAK